MTRLTYTKDDGSVSERTVIPIGFIFDDRDKVLCLDLSAYEGQELREKLAVAKELHRHFLNSVRDSELAGCYRTFFLDNISEVE